MLGKTLSKKELAKQSNTNLTVQENFSNDNRVEKTSCIDNHPSISYHDYGSHVFVVESVFNPNSDKTIYDLFLRLMEEDSHCRKEDS